MDNQIRMLLIGGPLSGKSSIVQNLLTESFKQNVDRVIYPVSISPERCNTNPNSQIILIDTFSIEAEIISQYNLVKNNNSFLDYNDLDNENNVLIEQGQLNQEEKEKDCEIKKLISDIKNSDILLVCYDLFNDKSKQDMLNIYLPFIHKINKEIPIVIVGTKMDIYVEDCLKENIADMEDHDFWNQKNNEVQIKYQMNKANSLFQEMHKDKKEYYNQIETVIEVSSKTSDNIDRLIQAAERKVLYPIQVLYDYKKRELKRNCVIAFTRIFRLINTDNNNLINRQELSIYNQKTFNSQLSEQEFAQLTILIQECDPDSYASEQQISLNGFLTLQKVMLEREKETVSWQFLKTYNYDRKLNNTLLNNDYHDVINRDIRVEISGESYIKLTNMFNRFSDNPNKIHIESLKIIFFDQIYVPWQNIHNIIHLEQQQYITIDNWINLWNYLAFFDPLKCFQSMIIIGIDIMIENAFIFQDNPLTNVNYSTLYDQQNRHYFHCLVIGEQNSGKSIFLKKFIQNEQQQDQSNQDSYSVIRNIKHKVNEQRSLILTELPFDYLDSYFYNKNFMNKVDFISIIGNFQEIESKYESILDEYLIPRIYIYLNNDEVKPLSYENYNHCQVNLQQQNFQQFFDCINKLIVNIKKGLNQQQMLKLQQNNKFYFYYLIPIVSIPVAIYLYMRYQKTKK